MEMTISGLREKLGEANDEQLRELICQLYKQSEVAQQIVDSRFLGDGYGLRIAKEANQKLELTNSAAVVLVNVLASLSHE